jgi:hypothetical protein
MAEKKDTKPTWISTQSELSKALQGWDTVTQDIKQDNKVDSKTSARIAPDEQILKDIEGIIQKIKVKLDEFAQPSSDITEPNQSETTENQ